MSDKQILKVNKFLQGVLESVRFTTDENGRIMTNFPGSDPTPQEIKVYRDGKPVSLPFYMPTEDQLKNSGTSTIKFFPFAESIWKGNSEVLNWLIRAMNAQLHIACTTIFIGLIKAKMDKDSQGKLGNNAFDIVKNIKYATKHSGEMKKLVRAMLKASPFGKESFAKLVLIRDPAKEENCTRMSYLRVIDSERELLYGLKPTRGARDAMETTINGMFPDMNDFVSKSSSKSSPNLYALLSSFATVADRLNEINNDLGDYKEENVLINSDWFDSLNDMNELSNFHGKYIIAKLEGNVGVDIKAESGVKVEESKVARKFGAANPDVKQPVENEQVSQPVSQPVSRVVRREDVRQQEEVEEYEEPVRTGPVGLVALGGGAGGTQHAKPLDHDFAKERAMQEAERRIVRPQQTTHHVPQHVQQTEIIRSGPKIRVVPPKQAKREVEVHAEDIEGNQLYWQSGEPFVIIAEYPRLNAYWACDRQGYGIFTNNGEPLLVDKYDRPCDLASLLDEAANSGRFQPSLHGGGMHHHHSRAPRYTQQELSRMSYTERNLALREMEEAEARYGSGSLHGSHNAALYSTPQPRGLAGFSNSGGQQHYGNAYNTTVYSEPQNRLGNGVQSFDRYSGIQRGSEGVTPMAFEV